MFKSFIKSAELTSTDGVHHNKEKYFENVEKVHKKNDNGVKAVGEQLLENQLRDEEDDYEWRINMYKPTEEELKFRTSFEKNRILEEKERLIEEKEIINNFKKAQANLTVKKNIEAKQKYNNLELLSNTPIESKESKPLPNNHNLLLKIKKRPENSLENEIEKLRKTETTKSTNSSSNKTSVIVKPEKKKIKSHIKVPPPTKKEEVKLNKFFEVYNSEDSGNEIEIKNKDAK